MEYCYEPEMEEAYRSSMLKAFKRTLEDGAFSFVIVDDRNLRVADFTQFWATAKRSGYEAYILEATYKDPTVSSLHTIYSSISLILYLICSFHF
jgi:YLP motif-containing protein 1